MPPPAHAAFTAYLADKMAPIIRAMMVLAVVVYVAAASLSNAMHAIGLPTLVVLAPALPLALVVLMARHARQPAQLSALALLGVVLLEIGSNLVNLGRAAGDPWVPGEFLIPVATSILWMGRWDFAIAMLLCTFGPLPSLLATDSGRHVLTQYTAYALIALAVAVVLRTFMLRSLRAQFELEMLLRRQARTDGLTGLLQRNAFLAAAGAALPALAAAGKRACLLYLDTDHFKRLNDEYGHAAGDRVLVQLAAMLRAESRRDDLVGRIGGEEFAILLPATDLAAGLRHAERLRLAAHAIRRPDGALTISIGVAVGTGEERLEALLARADQAMREAKRDGRDRVTSAA